MRQLGVDRWYPSVIRDAFHGFLLGEKLGEGLSRNVYVFGPDEDKVIKVETRVGYHQNIMEWKTWAVASESLPYSANLKKHLARCSQISQDGHFLIQERTWLPPPGFKWPDKMPQGLTDLKRSNFGLNKNRRLVCHDYGTNLLLNLGISKAMHKADWWD